MCAGSQFYLIDGGPRQKYMILEKTLKEKGCIVDGLIAQCLKAIIITHPDKHHFGGINQLLSKNAASCPIITTAACQLTSATKERYPKSDLLPIEMKTYFPTTSRRVYKNISCSTKVEKHWFRGNANESSVLVKIGQNDAILTGDSTGKYIHQELKLEIRSRDQ